MRLDEGTREQVRTLLTQCESMMKRIMDIASENDDFTVMREAAELSIRTSVLNKAILDRCDHTSITDEYNLYGDIDDIDVDDTDDDYCGCNLCDSDDDYEGSDIAVDELADKIADILKEKLEEAAKKSVKKSD